MREERSDSVSSNMDAEADKLLEFLTSIQLEQFFDDLREKLHITRLDHFDHVFETDLSSLDMTMPEVRRLFENLKKNRRRSGFLSKIRKSFRIHGSHPAAVIRRSPSISSEISLEGVEQGLKCLVDKKDLLFKEVLGSGAFGYVQKAEWLKGKEKVAVAVKCLQGNGKSSLAAVQAELIEEANAMSNLNHPNLIKLFGIVLTAPVMLVTELAPLGSLLNRIRKEPEQFPIAMLCSFVIQITAGMKYLETHHFVHRDLAARNILLMSYEKIKIGDFGLARPLERNMEYYVMQSDGLVPYAWCAPECLNYRKFSHSSDVWAFGITVVELFSYGLEPWAGLKGSEILRRIEEPLSERPPCPKHCPPDIYSIIRDCCWNYAPEERSHFASLEKYLLNVLPQEVKAVCDGVVDEDNGLSFHRGDIITVIDTNDDDVWIGQNRRTREVGVFPSKYVDFSRGTFANASTEMSPCSKNRTKSDASCDGSLKEKRVADIIDEEDCTCFSGCTRCEASDAESGRLSVASQHAKRLSGGTDSICSDYSSPGNKSRRSGSQYSYCEECASQQLSYDSGCSCRCSVYSSDSSKRNSDTNVYSAMNSESKPICIPGGKNSLRNHRNRSDSAIYQMFPYDSHKSSLPLSVEGELITNKLYDNIPNVNVSEKPTALQKVYDNVDSISASSQTLSRSPENRCSLPEIVNPNKKTEILQRRRSMPRLRKKKPMSYENKMFGSQPSVSILQISTDPAPNDDLTKSNTSLYDVIPSPKVEMHPSAEFYEVIPELKARPKQSRHSVSDVKELVHIKPVLKEITDLKPVVPPRHKRQQKRQAMSVTDAALMKTRQCVIIS